MTLYLVTEEGRRLWVAYESRADDRARIYVYVPNTGRFHYNSGASHDYYVDGELTFTPVTRTQAEQAMREDVGQLHRAAKHDQLDRYRNDTGSLDPADVLANAYS